MPTFKTILVVVIITTNCSGNSDNVSSESSSEYPNDDTGNFTLTIFSENGTVIVNPDLESYEEGTVVTLTATADQGCEFDSWSGDIGEAYSRTSSITIVMNADKSISARFVIEREDIYIAQNAQGNNSGNSCANAHSIDWLNDVANWTMVQEYDDLVGPGETVHLCGVFAPNPIETVLTIPASGTAGNPIVILFEDGARFTSPCFGGAFTMAGGAIFINQKEHIIIDGGVNGTIESTDTGTKGYFTYYRMNDTDNNIDGNIAVNILRSNNIQINNLNITNIYQSQKTFANTDYPGRFGDVGARTHSVGVYMYLSSNVSVFGNTITYVGLGTMIGVEENTGIEVHGNVFYRVGASIFSGGFTGVNADNVMIHHNRISDTTDWAYNDGIKIFAVPDTTDEFHGIRIHNNIIGPNISVGEEHPATAWILVDQGFIVEPEIYNNLLIAGEADGNAGRALHFIEVGGNGHATSQTVTQDGKIYNNTMVSESDFNTLAILVGKWSVGNEIYNNIIQASNNVTILAFTDERTSVVACDYNLLFSQQGNISGENECGGPSNIVASPLLDSEYRLTAASPAVNSGRTLGVGYTNYDLDDLPRPYGSGWDIGAYEYRDN